VGADAPPNDVGLAFNEWWPIFEGGPSIIRPSHFENPRSILNAFHAKALSESLGLCQIFDELNYCLQEEALLFWSQVHEVPPKATDPFVGWHSGLWSRETLEFVDHLFSGTELSGSTSSEIFVRLMFSRLPCRIPEPRLGSVNDALRSEEEAIFGDLNFKEVSLDDSSGPPNLLGDCHLPLRSNGDQCHGEQPS